MDFFEYEIKSNFIFKKLENFLSYYIKIKYYIFEEYKFKWYIFTKIALFIRSFLVNYSLYKL